MKLDIPLMGFQQACERFHANRQCTERGACSVPLAEALNWIVTIEDHLAREDLLGREWWRTITGGDTVAGLRFARNTVHHDWSLIMVLTHYLPHGGFDWRSQDWRWLPPHLLPEKRMSRGEDEYFDALAGALVADTLDTAARCFSEAMARVHPGDWRS